jgi:cell division transport system permease protein
MANRALRPLRGRDPLGLRRALADRLLPLLVAAMTMLAALAMGATLGAGAVASHWREAAAGPVTLHLPRGADPAAALARLRALPEVASADTLDAARLSALLAPWLGAGPGALPLPLLIEAWPREAGGEPAAFAARLAAALPQARIEAEGGWAGRVVRLAEGLRWLAASVLAVVAGVAVALVAVASRAGIAARRETILILHELGARDGDIAGRFARRLAWLCGLGGLLGVLAAGPVLYALAVGAMPLFTSREASPADLPWGGLLALPPIAALIGWATAQATVRRWLRRLP